LAQRGKPSQGPCQEKRHLLDDLRKKPERAEQEVQIRGRRKRGVAHNSGVRNQHFKGRKRKRRELSIVKGSQRKRGRDALRRFGGGKEKNFLILGPGEGAPVDEKIRNMATREVTSDKGGDPSRKRRMASSRSRVATSRERARLFEESYNLEKRGSSTEKTIG